MRSIMGSVAILLCLSSTACHPEACQQATRDMEDSIGKVCLEKAFANTPFCRCCVPAGFYSIDDTCTCQPLVLDTDFCFEKAGENGYPDVRAALDYAYSVCVGRAVTLRSGQEGDMCVASPTGADGGTDNDAAAIDGDAE